MCSRRNGKKTFNNKDSASVLMITEDENCDQEIKNEMGFSIIFLLIPKDSKSQNLSDKFDRILLGCQSEIRVIL